MSELLPLLDIGSDVFLTALATFLRVGAAMALFPAFGERSLPDRVRLVLALAFTLVVAPAAAPKLAPAIAEGGPVPLWMGTEVIAGLLLGIVIRLFVHALQMAGSIAAQSTSLAQIFGSAAVDPQPAMGHVLLIGGLALATLSGLHVRLAEALIFSYDMLPPGHLPGAAMIADWGLDRIARSFALAFSLSVPFVMASLVYNVALGVINRAMPQLMVAFVGAPAITAGGLILLALTAPILLEVWRDGLFAFLADPFAAP